MAKRKASGSSKAASKTRKTRNPRAAARTAKARTVVKKKKTAGAPARKKTASGRKAASVSKTGRSRTAKAAKSASGAAKKKAASRKTAAATRSKTAAPARAAKKAAPARTANKAARTNRRPRTDRRRDLDATIPTPPSSLDMNRRGSAARTGRAEIAEERAEHASLTPSITGGDVDADVENAYFSGDEAPGGDNPTPDQDIVDDIGRALGVEYQDNEELRGSDKVAARDRHRWELDPASSEDYKDRS